MLGRADLITNKNKEDSMSVKTKKRVKNLGKVIAIALFALLMFTNIKIATMDNSELANGDISLFGIEITLFDATDAYVVSPADCEQDLGCYGWQDICTVVYLGDGIYQICYEHDYHYV